jgi:hypothetical protein
MSNYRAISHQGSMAHEPAIGDPNKSGVVEGALL